jgi:DNA topoisomerase-1
MLQITERATFMSTLVIVESPNKVAKIQSYLGANYKVIPTYGHVCDLPQDEIGVKEGSFNPVYVTSESGKKTIAYIKSLMSIESKIIFATDPDREGESIAFHVARLLNISPDKVMRADIYEITKEAVILAVNNLRPLDMNLVKAQEARRVLDRLIGFKFSPKLTDLFGQPMAAGRVQSSVLKMMVDVEKKIKEFKKTKTLSRCSWYA